MSASCSAVRAHHGTDTSWFVSVSDTETNQDVHVPSCCAAGLQDIRLGIGYIEYALDAGCTGSLRYGRAGAREKVEIRGSLEH